jgi:hypothetical protein
MVGWEMNDELECIRKAVVVALINIKIAGVSAQI